MEKDNDGLTFNSTVPPSQELDIILWVLQGREKHP